MRESEGARYYFRRVGDLQDDEVVRKIVAPDLLGRFPEAIALARGVALLALAGGERRAEADTVERLLATDRTERGIWAAFLRIYADKQGRPIMGEKTPAHLAYVDTLLEWFPTAASST